MSKRIEVVIKGMIDVSDTDYKDDDPGLVEMTSLTDGHVSVMEMVSWLEAGTVSMQAMDQADRPEHTHDLDTLS